MRKLTFEERLADTIESLRGKDGKLTLNEVKKKKKVKNNKRKSR